MKKQIVVTGAAGFIASALVSALNERAYYNLVLVDDFSKVDKEKNYIGKKYDSLVEREHFFEWFEENNANIGFVFHLGARTDTTEMDKTIFDRLNLEYSCKMWDYCAKYGVDLIYASSAATYGDGSLGYEDSESVISELKPLNPYGESKNDFDRWVLEQKSKTRQQPPLCAGFKFFNVYGPNEYHKGRMASVVLHAFKQIKETGGMKLFRSHRSDYEDGMQSRDFVYVKDVVSVLIYFMEAEKKYSGLFNLGTGRARAFLHLAQATFKAMGRDENISFVDTPIDIRDKYQYYTQANISKLRECGYTKEFYSLEDGIYDYVRNYLEVDKIY